MGVWSIATGTYFAFHDDVLTRLVGRQAEMQFAYEDRIAELRAQVDRITSRQLLDQEQFEKKLNALLQRQAVLEQRSSVLSNDGLTTGSIRPTAQFAVRGSRQKPVADQRHRDSMTAIAKRGAMRPCRRQCDASQRTGAGLAGVLSRVSASLDKVEQRQTVTLANLEESYDSKARRIRNVLDDLGVDPTKVRFHAAMGGPFVPVRAAASRAPAPSTASFIASISRAPSSISIRRRLLRYRCASRSTATST